MGERAAAQDLVSGLSMGYRLIDAVEHTLRAYTWNLIEGYRGNLVFRVTEIDESEGLSFCGRRPLLQF